MKRTLFFLLVIAAGCHHSSPADSLTLIQIQDRNGLTETISHPDRLSTYTGVDFCSTQPYKKVQRIFRSDGKNHSKVTTYHPNGMIWQYLEAEEMRARGTYREWFPNGQLKIEATIIGGSADVTPAAQEDWLFDSVSQVWDEQGNLIAQIPYQKGMLEGVSVYFYPSGQIEREVPFIKNEMEGNAVEFSPNGAIKSRVHYEKGVKEGQTVSFFNNEKLALEEDYSEGFLRTGNYYNPQGELISKVESGGGFQALYEGTCLSLVEFRVGKPEGLVRKFTSSGELQRSFYVKNGKKHGEEIEFYLGSEMESGAKKDRPLPKLAVTWSDNVIQGPVKTWYNHGQLQSQREYARNQKSGPSLAWYRDGSLMMLEEYEEECLVSGQYYKIHKPEPVSTISNGNGLATLYDETGALLRKVTYLKGKPVDPEN